MPARTDKTYERCSELWLDGGGLRERGYSMRTSSYRISIFWPIFNVETRRRDRDQIGNVNNGGINLGQLWANIFRRHELA